MSPYRQPGVVDRRRAVIAEARRVRDALGSTPTIHNIGGTLRSSVEIVDVLTGCIHELEISADAIVREEPFA